MNIKELEKLIEEGMIYLIQNNRQGCFQLGISRNGIPDLENDEVVEIEAYDYN